MSDFGGEDDFLNLIRQRQEADQEEALAILDRAEEEFAKSLLDEEPDDDFVEKSSPWTDAVEGKFGKNIAIYKHKDGSSFWVTKGNAIVGWVERRGKKWLSRPVGREEWTGDNFKSAVSQIVSPLTEDNIAPPPGA